jgi:hypothetical protein
MAAHEFRHNICTFLDFGVGVYADETSGRPAESKLASLGQFNLATLAGKPATAPETWAAVLAA